MKPPKFPTPTGHRLQQDKIKSKLSAVLRNIEAGNKVAAACRMAGISVPTYYRWTARGKMGDENSSLNLRESDRIRAAILQAGKTAFLREGFGASLDKVAAAAGVARQTLYNQFGSKDRLFAEVVQTLYQQVLAPVFVFEDADDLVAMLTACARGLLKLMLDPEAVELLRITLGEYRNHPELATLAYAIRTSRIVPNVAGAVTTRLQEEMARGTIDRVDPLLAAETFIGSFSAHARHRALVGLKPPSARELEDRIQLAVHIFVQGLGYARERAGTA